MENGKFLRGLVVVGLALLISACTQSTMQLSQSLPKNTSVSTVATFHDQAYFHNAPFFFQGKDFSHSIPDFHPNAAIVKSVNKRLKSSGYNVVHLPYSTYEHSPLYKVDVVSVGKDVSATYKKYLSAVMKSHPVKYIVLVAPDRFSEKVGNVNYILPEYGVTSHVILGMKSAKAYTSFRMYVIDTSTWQVIGSTNGQFSEEVPTDVRQDNYMSIPPATIARVGRTLESILKYQAQDSAQKIGVI